MSLFQVVYKIVPRVIGTGPLVHYFGSINLPLRFAGGGGIMKKNKTCYLLVFSIQKFA